MSDFLKTVEHWEALLETMRGEGQTTVNGQTCSAMVATFLNEISQLMDVAINEDPRAVNYLMYKFKNDKHPERSFNVIIQKHGGSVDGLKVQA